MLSLKQLLKASLLITCCTSVAEVSASSLLTNGNFENGLTGFTTGYVHGDGSTTSLLPEGQYEVGADPNRFHAAFAPITAQNGSSMMIVNGATQDNAVVWSEGNLAIQANTTYYFSGWIASLVPHASAKLALRINGQDIGTFEPTLDSDWQQFSMSWYSGSDTTALIALVDKDTTAFGNDFALDNLYFDTMATGAVPEPSSLALLGLGMGAAALLARRRRQPG